MDDIRDTDLTQLLHRASTDMLTARDVREVPLGPPPVSEPLQQIARAQDAFATELLGWFVDGDVSTAIPDDTACPLEEWNAKVDRLLAEVAQHQQEETP